MTWVYQIFLSELWFLCLSGPSCMTCVHQIFPFELWFLGLYLVLHVWHVYIRFFLPNYGFLASTWFFMYDMCPLDINYGFFVYLVLYVWHMYIRSFLLIYGFFVYLVLHVWHVYIRSFLLNYGFLVSTWSFMYDMCTSYLSFWTMVLWSLNHSSCMTCVHQIWTIVSRSTWSFMYDMYTSDLSFWTMVSWSQPGPSCMTCVHQIFPSELWFLGLYLVLHVWHVYIRSFLLNYGFLVSTWSFMYDMCNHIFPSELWFLGLYLVLHVCHVYIRSFLLNYDFLV